MASCIVYSIQQHLLQLLKFHLWIWKRIMMQGWGNVLYIMRLYNENNKESRMMCTFTFFNLWSCSITLLCLYPLLWSSGAQWTFASEFSRALNTMCSHSSILRILLSFLLSLHRLILLWLHSALTTHYPNNDCLFIVTNETCAPTSFSLLFNNTYASAILCVRTTWRQQQDGHNDTCKNNCGMYTQWTSV